MISASYENGFISIILNTAINSRRYQIEMLPIKNKSYTANLSVEVKRLYFTLLFDEENKGQLKLSV